MSASYNFVSDEIGVNTLTAQNQTAPAITRLPNGGYVVVWGSLDTAQDGSGSAIKAQVFNANGQMVGSEFLVNQFTAGNQFTPQAATLSDGSFVVTWSTGDTTRDGSGNAIAARRFDISGAPLGNEFIVNTSTTSSQFNPNITALANGGYMISWDDWNGFDVRSQVFNADGTRVGNEFRVNSLLTANQEYSDLATLSNGNVVAVWRTTNTADDGSGYAIKGRIFNASGTAVGAEFRVNAFTNGDQQSPSITALANGNFVVTWETWDTSRDGNSYAIVGQVFSASGQAIGSEFVANTLNAGMQREPVVTGLPDGGFAIGWTTYAPTADGSGSAISLQIFDAAGARVGTEMRVNQLTTGAQFLPDIATLADGRIVTSWVSDNGDGSGYALRQRIIGANAVNAAPIINSDGGGAVAALAVGEGHIAVTTVSAVDPEGRPLTYSIVGGADAAKFTINSATGALAFITAPDYEAPSDAGGNNVYDVVVQVSDGEQVDTQAISVTVGNVNEAPEIYGGASASAVVAENSSYVTTVAVSDVDGPAISFSIVGGADAALFTIDVATGVLSFIAAPNFEAPGDANQNNIYEVDVAASDGSLIDTQSLNISVANLNEAPEITSGGGAMTASYAVAEGATSVGTIAASDPDGDQRSYSIVGGADAERFTLDAVTGALSFIDAPNFSAPADSDGDNVYEVIVQASDGSLSDTQSVFITVTHVNEAPVITSNGGGETAAIAVGENGLAVTTMSSTDSHNSLLNYSIVGGADAALFTIDAATGELRFINAPNYEAPSDADSNNIYDVVVQVSDGILTDSQVISVTVGNVNEAPVIYGGDSALAIAAENSILVANIAASDVDSPTISFSITGGADAALFTIDAVTGALRFIAPPNYEAPGDIDHDNVYEVGIAVSDGSLIDTQSLYISVANVNEAPVIVSGGGGAAAAYAVNEGVSYVGAIAATDPENNSRSYAIIGGADAALFVINAATGALSFTGVPDFEAPTDADGNNVYELIVQASDGSLVDTQAISVKVNNVYEAPVITSNGGGATAAITINENTLAVTTVASTQPDGNPNTYYIAGGSDSKYFTINASTGVLSFINAPNFEAPADSDRNNVYNVVVQATNSMTLGMVYDTQAIAVTITNVNEAPVFALNGGGATATVYTTENSRGGSDITATDPEGAKVTYSIVGGADASQFVLVSTGSVVFASAHNYEAPTDADGNNRYEVIVRASDGIYSTTQALTIVVLNLADGSTINGTSGANTLVGTNAEDVIYGLAGNDIITGGLGKDILYGGAGADRFVYNSIADSQVGSDYNPLAGLPTNGYMVNRMDEIRDFSHAEGDRISLSGIDANANLAGDQAFTFIGSAAFTNVAGQLHYQQVDSFRFLVEGDVNGDGMADFVIRVDTNVAPVSSDFIL